MRMEQDLSKNHSQTLTMFVAKLTLTSIYISRAFPNYQAYSTPIYFQSDWLNEFWDTLAGQDDSGQDDYRFVYMGPKGTWYICIYVLPPEMKKGMINFLKKAL